MDLLSPCLNQKRMLVKCASAIYGADAVRWFMLSDSPPERDIQWSDEGIAGSHKFIQKVWTISEKIQNISNTKKLSENTKLDLEKTNQQVH